MTMENSPATEIKWPKRRPNRQHLRHHSSQTRPLTSDEQDAVEALLDFGQAAKGAQFTFSAPPTMNGKATESKVPTALENPPVVPQAGSPADSMEPSAPTASSKTESATPAADSSTEPAPGTGKHYRRNQLKRHKAAAKKKAAREGQEQDDAKEEKDDDRAA